MRQFMLIDIHNFLNSKYNTSIKILKGKQTIKTDNIVVVAVYFWFSDHQFEKQEFLR